MNNKKNKLDHLNNHALYSRRDFVSHGLVSGLSFAFVPSLLSMLYSNSAKAIECQASSIGGTNRIPILIIDLAGGGNIPGSNVMVGKAGNQMDFINSYETLGLPSAMHPKNSGQINTDLGLAFHGDSAILRGISSTTAAGTRAKLDGGIFCGISNDDTGNNPHNPAYWLAKAGAVGELATIAGTRNSDSGGNSIAPMESIVQSLKPVTLNRPQDALNLINIGRLGTLFGQAKSEKIMKSIERLSETQIRSFSNKSLPLQIKDLVSCGYIQSQDVLNKYSAAAIDPTLDTAVTQTFNNLNDGNQRKVATMAKLILDGHIGVATVELGGFDYHTNDRATGEGRDLDLGSLMGRVFQLASLKRKNIMIYVFTDGGVSAGNTVDNSGNGRGKLVWAGDSSQRSSSFMMVYRDAGRATLRKTNRRQIGSFKDNGTVDGNASLISNSVMNLNKTVVANYLSLSGQESKIVDVVGDNIFGGSIDDYLFFNKIT